ncbi:MAG: cyclic nucleotide-binding domain-containing protein [Hyphomicrobiales bacterium]
MEDILGLFAQPGSLVIGAGACYVLGLLFKNQIILRILILIGTGLYIGYYYLAAAEPLWGAIYTSVLIGIANIIGFINLLISQSPRFIAAGQMDLYNMLGGMEPGNFRKLMKTGHRRILDSDEQLTVQGTVPEKLFYILSGEVIIDKDGNKFNAGPRVFVGEISIILGTAASASAFLAKGAEIVEWDRNTLLKEMAAKDSFRVAVEAIIGKDMAQKVAASSITTHKV